MPLLQKKTGLRWQGRYALLVSVLALTLGGCASPVTGLQNDLGLRTLTFPFDRIAIGGVVADGKTDAEVERHFSSLLYKRLVEKRKPLTVLSLDDVRNGIGLQDCQELLKEYRKEGSLGKRRLSALQEKLGVRYLVLARLSGGDAYENRLIRPETGNNGKALVDRQRVTKGAIRSVVVSLKIYDLETRRSVWSGWISRDKRSEVEYIHYAGTPLVTMVTPGKTSPDDGVPVVEPDAPMVDLDGLIDDAFAVFADSLPTI